MSYTLYKIINKDGNPIDIKVVKEYNSDNNDDVLDQYLEKLSDDEFNKLNHENHRFFKVLVEDEKIIKERTEKWQKKIADCVLDKNSDLNCDDVLKTINIKPQFNMDILVVDKKDIVEPANAPAATPVAAQGGNRRRRNNKKSKRKSKNNRKKTNRRR
jgi:hypothetical protein